MKKTFTILIAFLCGTALLFGQVPHKLEKSGEYWLIDSPEDLIWLADELNLDPDNDGTPDFDNIEAKCASNYKLEADITFDPDSSLVDWNNDGVIDILVNDASGLAPIGYWSGEDYFSGTFDGQYHTIWNIYKSGRSRTAFFANLKDARIENLRLMNYRAYADLDYVAGIASRATVEGETGYNTIKRCWVEGQIRATRIGNSSAYSGGIIGRLKYGEVIECVSKVSIMTNLSENSRRAGGIVGRVSVSSDPPPLIQDCYSVSTITIFEQGGGIAGYINEDSSFSASIINCWSASNIIDADKNVGSVAGDFDATIVESTYFDSDIMATGVGNGDDASIAAVAGIPTAQFANEGNFFGWDFASTWKMGDVYGVQRPYLQWQDLVGEEVSVNDLNESGLIKAYPNPVTGTLNIENAPLNASYRMMNLVGQTIESGLITSSHMLLNTENYQKGIYLLQIGDQVNKILVK